jgi:glycosyltransferase involved in cell wall biosynthesis
MILLVHKDEKVIKIVECNSNELLSSQFEKPLHVLFDLAHRCQNSLLIWCHESVESNVNYNGIKSSFKLKNTLLSYSKINYIPEQIGYVEDSPFIKVNKSVKYPTWLVSSWVGVVHASQLILFDKIINKNEAFDFGLNSIAKLGMPQGLFCYSEPNLIHGNPLTTPNIASAYTLFKFVKTHYKGVWGFLLLINFIVNEKKCLLVPFLRTLFVKKKIAKLNFDLQHIKEIDLNEKITLDVVIPTIGRAEHVYNFLKDLEAQTHKPNQVIIIEQNKDENSVSSLDFIKADSWSFKIIHKFIYQTGACNARNLALAEVASDYTFLADDDIRIQEHFLDSVLNKMQNLGLFATTLSCLGVNDIKSYNKIMQWTAFGSGCSIVKTNELNGVKFDMKYEFGYGEDVDFGMQLRNKGVDIIYLPSPEIVHLKAPIGGFRTKFIHPWENDKIQPKPSPTVMLNRMQNSTTQQLLGYRTTLFIKYYRQQDIKNPFKYFFKFKKQWLVSKTWANRLNNNL